jgi:hypothetical protein
MLCYVSKVIFVSEAIANRSLSLVEREASAICNGTLKRWPGDLSFRSSVARV